MKSILFKMAAYKKYRKERAMMKKAEAQYRKEIERLKVARVSLHDSRLRLLRLIDDISQERAEARNMAEVGLRVMSKIVASENDMSGMADRSKNEASKAQGLLAMSEQKHENAKFIN